MTNVVNLDAFRRNGCVPEPKVSHQSPTHHADSLSFMRVRKPKGTGIDYWLVSPTGNYTDDCEVGRKLADEYLAYIGEHPTNGNTTLLTCIVREMIDRAIAGQKWSGTHVGFLAGVNRYAMAMAMYRSEVGDKSS
jgi:hypothetical protein